MNIKFKKSVAKEIRYSLRDLLEEYEAITPMTGSERGELYKWVADGNSPYENPSLYYDESGWPMDFIAAKRLVEDLTEQMLTQNNHHESILDCSYPFENGQVEPAFMRGSPK
jgi:hypothetical protein